MTYKLLFVVELFLKVINLIWLELFIARSACFPCCAMPLPFPSLHLALATVPPSSPALGLQVALQVWVPSRLCLVPSPRLPIRFGCPGSITSPRRCRDSRQNLRTKKRDSLKHHFKVTFFENRYFVLPFRESLFLSFRKTCVTFS